MRKHTTSARRAQIQTRRGAAEAGFVAAVVAGVLLLTGCGSTQTTAAPKHVAASVAATSSAATPTPVPVSSSAASDPTSSLSSSPSTPTSSSASATTGSAALKVLATLPVKGRAPMTGYTRDRFGQAWLDADQNGCDTRSDTLGRFLTQIVYRTGTHNCIVESGTLDDPYTGQTIHYVRGDTSSIDIDHVVALGDAWVTGASAWPIKKRAALANDPLNLLPVDYSQNRQKGDSDAASWLPQSKSYRCGYVARQISVKAKYGLWVTSAEKAAMATVLNSCPTQGLIPDSGAPTEVPLNITDPGAPATSNSSTSGGNGSPSGSTSDKAPAAATGKTDPRFPTCTAAEAAGFGPYTKGEIEYSWYEDRDGDGTVCE